MRKLALFLALTAGALMPITAVAQNSSTSSSKKRSKKSKKSSKQADETPVVESTVEEQPSTPAAQSFSNEQIMLNNQAVVATKEQNYQKAEQLFNAMLQIGEFNIIWMNLGRTYTSQNKCIEAADAFARVATAPPIADFPAEVINAKTDDYIRELNDQCSSTVVLNCNPPDATITIDGGMELVCTSDPIKLVPGRHSIYAKTSYGFNTVVVDTNAYETSNVDVSVVDYEQVVNDAGITLVDLNKKSKLFKALGYSFIGAGAAVMGGGFGLMGYAYFVHYPETHGNDLDIPLDQDANKYREERQKVTYRYLNSSYAMVAVGGAMLAAGVALVIIDAVNYVPQIKTLESAQTGLSDFRFSPVFSPEFAGLSFGAAF
jgi:tetratricopeptide (TPR) repeat protein